MVGGEYGPAYIARVMVECGVKDPWKFIGTEYKEQIAWQRFYVNLLSACLPK